MIDWLMDEGIEIWPSLLASQQSPSVSPTLPFSLHTGDEGALRNVFECPEQQEDGSFAGIAFNSWFINHAHWPRCPASRVIIFGQSQESWANQIARIWRDRYQAGRPYSVTWVNPRPVTTGRAEFDLLPHVIIEQGFLRGKVSAHLSVAVQQEHSTEVSHVEIGRAHV